MDTWQQTLMKHLRTDSGDMEIGLLACIFVFQSFSANPSCQLIPLIRNVEQKDCLKFIVLVWRFLILKLFGKSG